MLRNPVNDGKLVAFITTYESCSHPTSQGFLQDCFLRDLPYALLEWLRQCFMQDGALMTIDIVAQVFGL